MKKNTQWSTKPKSNKTPKIPMKSLDWTKFEKKDIKGTIWDLIDYSNIKFNPDEFRETFAKNAPISMGKQKNY